MTQASYIDWFTHDLKRFKLKCGTKIRRKYEKSNIRLLSSLSLISEKMRYFWRKIKNYGWQSCNKWHIELCRAWTRLTWKEWVGSGTQSESNLLLLQWAYQYFYDGAELRKKWKRAQDFVMGRQLEELIEWNGRKITIRQYMELKGMPILEYV